MSSDDNDTKSTKSDGLTRVLEGTVLLKVNGDKIVNAAGYPFFVQEPHHLVSLRMLNSEYISLYLQVYLQSFLQPFYPRYPLIAQAHVLLVYELHDFHLQACQQIYL